VLVCKAFFIELDFFGQQWLGKVTLDQICSELHASSQLVQKFDVDIVSALITHDIVHYFNTGLNHFFSESS
jgi:hypothetical protein